MKYRITAFLLPIMVLYACTGGRGSEVDLHLYTTGDVHGSYFDSLYTGSVTKESLLSVAEFIDVKRSEYGSDHVILVDAGDFLQGDNAAYYYNDVDTTDAHVLPLMAADMGYDAMIVGNHDIETGPAVYDRIQDQLTIPWLAANAIERSSGKCHFGEYTVINRCGIKIAIVGLTNPNMSAWLDESQMNGIDFINPRGGFAQKLVNRVRRKEKPDIVILVIHSGTGDESHKLENQGLDILHEVKGVDVVVCAHDHKSFTAEGDGNVLVNGGSHAKNVGHVQMTLALNSRGKVKEKRLQTEIIPMDKNAIDKQMMEKYRNQFLAVRSFSNRNIGAITSEMKIRDSYFGMCFFMNFLHSVCLQASGADVCILAPLKLDGTIHKGEIIYNDLFSIYQYENQLFVVQLTGDEIHRYLEFSYDLWIDTTDGSNDHLLKIQNSDDERSGKKGWSFVNRSYNFDSAAGICYTVDVTKPAGSRINILSMADGKAFDPQKSYKVAMTSYRANGGGDHVVKALGMEGGVPDEKIIEKNKDVREIIYDYFKTKGTVTPESVGNPTMIGHWEFIPADVAGPMLEKDRKILFP